jgi:hypothetical protein
MLLTSLRSLEEKSVDVAEMSNQIEELELTLSQLKSNINELNRNSGYIGSTAEKPSIVIRIDDIQDYAFRDGQIFLLEYNLANRLPMSLAVISGSFGNDKELVEIVTYAVKQNSEITAHGSELLTEYELNEQISILQSYRDRLSQVLGVEVSVLTPPCFAFNNNTLLAMKQAGYSTITSHIDLSKPGILSENIVSVPATVEFSDFHNGTWQPKDTQTLMVEISRSIRLYGNAVIVTHPQEFYQGDKFDPDRFETYTDLIQKTRELYSFTVIENLQERSVS